MGEEVRKFGPSLKSCGLGDTLLLTAICKYAPMRYTIQLPSSKAKYSILFQGLANVELSDSPNVLKDIGSGHYTTQKLRGIYGNEAELLDNRPLVLYSDIDSEKWANDFLKEIKNPIVFVSGCSPQWAKVRNINADKAEQILEILTNNGYTPIICSNSENPFISNKEDSTINLKNIPLHRYICLLRRVGRYIGCNTGDMHLAISVGAITKVFQPSSQIGFDQTNWNYNHPTVEYYLI